MSIGLDSRHDSWVNYNMQSRGNYGGRGGGRGNRYQGRGRGSFGGRRPTETKPTEKTKEYKFMLHIGRSNHNANTSYTSVKEHIILYIKKTFTEGGKLITKAIQDLKEPNFDELRPTLQKSKLTNQPKAAEENEIFKSLLIDESRIWADMRRDYETAKDRAYGLILQNYTDGALKARIEAQSDYATRNQDNQPSGIDENNS